MPTVLVCCDEQVHLAPRDEDEIGPIKLLYDYQPKKRKRKINIQYY
jgi:hypothetical protein